MGFDDCLGLYDMDFSVVIQKTIECLKDFRRSKIELIQNNPVSLPYSLNKSSFSEYKLALVRCVRDIATKVLLDIRVHMVVNPQHFVVCCLGQIINTRSLSSRSRTFQNNSEVSDRYDRC
jgi:hypothetical protein